MRLICKALPERLSSVTIRNDDHYIICDPRDLIGRSIVFHGSWARTETERVIRFLEKEGLITGSGIALDLGANIGTQTLYIHLTGKFRKVVSVEAAPKNFDLLQANIRINGWSDAIKALHAAVYTKDGTIKLNLAGQDVGGGHSLLNIAGNTETLEVPALTVESILRETGTEANEVEFVWMDIEGFDFEILKEIQKTCGSGLPVFFEFSPDIMGKQKTAECIEFINSNYTRIYAIRSEGEDLEPISDTTSLRHAGHIDLLVFSR